MIRVSVYPVLFAVGCWAGCGKRGGRAKRPKALPSSLSARMTFEILLSHIR